MIEALGTVVKVEGVGRVWVDTMRQSTCGSCIARKGCGQSLAQTYLKKRGAGLVRVYCGDAVAVGDQVVVGMPEERLLTASFQVYAIPLLALMMMIGLSVAFQFNDFLTLLSCIAGLLLGFFLVRRLDQKGAERCRIQVVKHVPEAGFSVEH